MTGPALDPLYAVLEPGLMMKPGSAPELGLEDSPTQVEVPVSPGREAKALLPLPVDETRPVVARPGMPVGAGGVGGAAVAGIAETEQVAEVRA